jgi:hypothetical protein
MARPLSIGTTRPTAEMGPTHRRNEIRFSRAGGRRANTPSDAGSNSFESVSLPSQPRQWFIT